MNQRSRMFASMALVMTLAFLVAGCAGASKVRIGAKQMCEAHSGTYNAQTQQCSYQAVQRSARESCEYYGGMYLPEEQYCAF
jgi:hypothetical protein